MSGHAEDTLEEESKRFFTFFNLSMALVAITGLEIVIIYVQTFEGSTIIATLFATSIVKFIGVVWWFMHLKWDKFLNTVLFLMGLVIALATYFAVIYMADVHPEVEKFEVTELKQEWTAGTEYSKGDYVLYEGNYYKSKEDHKAPEECSLDSWEKVQGIPHRIAWKINVADLVEINSKSPANPFFHLDHPEEQENIDESEVFLLTQSATTADFRIKVRSEAYWTENQ
jgi:cytochrome c oxidase subunit 4